MDFTSANEELWGAVVTIGFLSCLILLANLLRRKIPFIRKALIPTSVLAGFIGLLLRSIGLIKLDSSLMEMLTYHALAIGFTALGLRTPRLKELDGGQKKGEGIFTSFNTGMLIVSNYLLQGVVGLAITLIASVTFAPGFFQAAGIILPMGYGQGPGQANNVGTMYESLGFTGGSSFGLAIASFGFLWASIGGLAYLVYLRKQGKLPIHIQEAEHKHQDVLADHDELPLSEPIDKLTLQVALIFMVYLMSYGFIFGVLKAVELGMGTDGLYKTLNSLLWGFNFIVASSIALLMRIFFQFLRKKRIMTHQYPNNYLLNRISGLAFDAMIVGGISSISIGDLQDKWPVFLLLTTVGGIVTLFYNHYMSKVVYPSYAIDGMMAMYGMLTGTASTGVMLLSTTDPSFLTPMSNNLITGSSTAILFGAPILIMVGLAPKSTMMTIVTLLACLGYLTVLHVALLIRCKKRYKKTEKTTKS